MLGIVDSSRTNNTSMSHSTQGQKRTKSYMACSHCRQRHIRCEAGEDYRKPCKRCKRKGLECIYEPVGSGGSSSSDAGNAGITIPKVPNFDTPGYNTGRQPSSLVPPYGQPAQNVYLNVNPAPYYGDYTSSGGGGIPSSAGGPGPSYYAHAEPSGLPMAAAPSYSQSPYYQPPSYCTYCRYPFSQCQCTRFR
ncbi:hypothetical protein MIND_00596200 [Mycena indigotica]|uniref:Zn(2)-C6 fungal-type domain-containing protein n=1 Tax=Mycena indigotica TaxID=2126181 RepID=A0A8H6SR38_9AGAR|nr:uncharacterized protein MIND_00596200 [Mycena indigotica]KAF7303668.1 hypothetical protein MIND_00596200 [Mycena indigotica]